MTSAAQRAAIADELIKIANTKKRRLDETDAQTIARMKARLIAFSGEITH